MAAMRLLETTALTRHFGGLAAVDKVDFSLPEGQVHALIGPNGAGKSTFVGLVAGRISPSAGEIRFDGTNVTALAADARIRLGMAYTFQITSIYARLSLFDNIALALRHRSESDVLAILDRVGLANRAGQLAGDLAYGHQRLLEIAMGIAQQPRLLILDEPTQGLAESEIDGFNALIGQLRNETTILLIEHNMDVVMALADAITVLDSGRVLATGTPQAIRADKTVQDVYLGTAHAQA